MTWGAALFLSKDVIIRHRASLMVYRIIKITCLLYCFQLIFTIVYEMCAVQINTVQVLNVLLESVPW